MLLTDTFIRSVKPTDKLEKYRDGGSLFLHVKPNGTKLFIMAYRFEGKQKTLSIGIYPHVSLKDARKHRDEAKELLSKGIDPSQNKQKKKNDSERKNSFNSVSEEWIKNKSSTWSHRHLETVRQRVQDYILPEIGHINIDEVTPHDVLKLIRIIESRGAYEAAKRTLGICSMIFRYGVSTLRCNSDPCRDLKGALITRKAKSFGAITKEKEAAQLMRAIYAYYGSPIVCNALKFSALTFCRPGEIRQAEWKEFDINGKKWIIPAHKMKMRVEHVVPLSRQALEIVQNMHSITSESIYVFHTPRTKLKPLSENAVRAALQSMGYTGDIMTPHGFRAMASTLLNEQGQLYDVIEAQLAHAGKDKVRAVYNRAEYMEQRVQLMQFWSDYLDRLRVKVF